MDLRRWTHVVAVADCRSFVRAAERVHLSQPALTRSIQAAEAELGLRLFDRGTLEVVPTPAGEFVIARARQLVFNSHCLERDVELYRNRSLGDTAFGVGPFPAATFLSPLLAGLRREFPQVRLRVEVSNWQQLFKRLLEEDIEFFVADTRDLPVQPNVQIRKLRREPGGFFVRAGHPLGRKKPVTIQQVWEHGVASVRLPVGVREVIARLLDAAPGNGPPVALECDDVETLKRVALDSDTVLGAPLAAVEPEVAAGTLRRLAVTGLPEMVSEMGVVSLRGRTPSPMAELVMARLPR
ncbi:LysR family transcriptional regulator [Piscinibacter terrae]|uniref:LysR family transcriptional regulator n=1 Tax=Piscinibacter terrae TaxID=2496871 RepID=A0A3N7JTW3_9BURK|nr:LysR family transcriptional regulator [Albitalea terrae]RQP22405.1 LysR family transcriptional regulator [Albitalea terrae]